MFEHIIVDFTAFHPVMGRRFLSLRDLDPSMERSQADERDDSVGRVATSSAEDDNIDSREVRLYPFFYLIADRVSEVGGMYASGRPGVEFVTRGTDINQGRPHWLDHSIDGTAVFFSPSKSRKRVALQISGLTSKTAVLLLAAAGLDITVPGFSISIVRTDEVARVREKLAEERARYRIAITRLADEALERLNANVYGDTVDWALNEANLKIRPRAEEFQLAMRKLDRPLLERLGADFVTDGLPAIGSSLLSDGFAGGGKKFVEVLLSLLCRNLMRSIQERRSPDVVYGYKVRSELDELLRNG